MPSTDALAKHDLSSTPSALHNCTPTAQGSSCLYQKFRLPASLDSLKPAVFQAELAPNLQLAQVTESGERMLMVKLIAELNLRFNTGLAKNFSTGREGPATAEDSLSEVPDDYILIVGSSHGWART